MKIQKMLTRGKGNFINCTDYDDAIEYAKQQAIEFAEWLNLAKEAYYNPEYDVWVVSTGVHETKPIGNSEEVYAQFLLERSQIAQKEQSIIAKVSVAKRTVCGKEAKTCRFLIPSSNGCDYIHNCESKQTER